VFRRSGGFVTFLVAGKLPAPDSQGFRDALAQHRFRTIETAAAEQVSVGWVTPRDPTGETFEPEHMRCGNAWWLRVRVDRKQLPAAWVAIYRAAAEHGAGRPLSVREKRELREDLERKLLPRVLPAVKLVDVLWLPERGAMLLFATSRAAQEQFERLVRLTFGKQIEPAAPLRLAQALGLQADHLSPVRWPDLERRVKQPAESAAPAAVAAEETS
jgi:DNA recombination-dependent growth factor C